MRWLDRVYGDISIDDTNVLKLIDCPTFQRLKGIRQAGPSAIAFPFKNVSRFEHSLGVYNLLRLLGADHREQIAGLLHDLSHTAFSHAVDFLYTSEEQNHHEGLKPEFLRRPDIKSAIEELGFSPSDFDDDSIYPLLERPLPWLCADRLDYFLRDGLACGVLARSEVARILGSVEVVDRTIAFNDATTARYATEWFAVMNHEWWASPTEAYVYNEFARALRRGLDLKVIGEDDLLSQDDEVFARLQASTDPEILGRLERIIRFNPENVIGYVPRIIPKMRWLDPPVNVGDQAIPLSKL